MTTGSLEHRVATLEAQVADLLSSRNRRSEKDWRKTLGIYSGDELMRQICQNALTFRDQDRR
jgi:hypothetical protein